MEILIVQALLVAAHFGTAYLAPAPASEAPTSAIESYPLLGDIVVAPREPLPEFEEELESRVRKD